MYFENSLTSNTIGQRNSDMAVKTTRTQQRIIQYVHTVRCCQHHYSCATIETVQFHEQLIECLITFVITAHAHGTLAPHGIQFINKDDTWGALTRLIEQVTHSTGTDANVHLHEFGCAHAEERHTCFTGDRLCQQRFTSSRRANQQRTTRNTRTQPPKSLRAT